MSAPGDGLDGGRAEGCGRAEARQARWGTRGRLVAAALALLRMRVEEIPLDVDPTDPAGFEVLFALTLWKADRREEALAEYRRL